MTPVMTTDRDVESRERADLLETLGKHRFFLRHTTNGLSDEEAARRTTASELCVGGLIKHVALVESRWAEFIVKGPEAMGCQLHPETSAHVIDRAATSGARWPWSPSGPPPMGCGWPRS